MPIPTSYTYATFRDYLENEVLQSVADAMGWKDVAASGGVQSITVNYFISGSTSAFWALTAPLTVDIPAGTYLKTIGGTITTVALDARKGDMAIKTNWVQSAGGIGVAPSVEADGTKNTVAVTFAVKVPSINAVDADPIYDAITDEVILKLGYEDPEEVPASLIPKMRLLGRVEMWRAVTYNTVADTTLVFGDSLLQRQEVFENSLNQLKIADAEYRTKYPATAPAVSKPRAATYAGAVTLRW